MPGIGILSDASAGRRSGILTFSLTRLDNSGLFAHLQDAGVLCAQRGGGIRMSPHFYTPMAQIERTLLLIDDWLSTNAARNP
jgi:selenocysteine lyase/cysteine desulfurase